MANNEEDKNLNKELIEEVRALYNVFRDKIPERQGEFLGEEKDHFYIALSEDEIYELSALAYYVWLLCDGEHTVDDIITRASKELGIDRESMIEPIILALNGLSLANLVVFKSSSSDEHTT